MTATLTAGSARAIADLNRLGLYADDRWGDGDLRAMADDFELRIRLVNGVWEVGPNAFPARRGIPFPTWHEALVHVRAELREHEKAIGWKQPRRRRRPA